MGCGRAYQIVDNTSNLIRNCLVAVRILGEDVVDWNFRCNKQLCFALIAGCKRGLGTCQAGHAVALTIDKSDKSPCLLAVLSNRSPKADFDVRSYLILEVQTHLRHIQQEYRSEGLRDLDVICGAKRFPAKVIKLELGDLARALGDDNRTAPCVQFSVRDYRIRRVC